MARINKHDTDGTKGILLKGEIGYDDYPAGGDAERVYVGNGTDSIPLAHKSETDALDTTLNDHIGSGETSHALVTVDDNGFMASTDKIRLNAIEDEANKYVLPETVLEADDYATTSVGGTIIVGDGLDILGGVLTPDLEDDYITNAMLQASSVSLDKLTDFVAGSWVVASGTTADSVTTTGWVKYKEIKVPRKGTLTTRFGMKAGGGSWDVYGTIYINGSAEGTPRNTQSTSTVYYSEDLAVEAGDLVQLYARTGSVSYPSEVSLLSLATDTNLDTFRVLNS